MKCTVLVALMVLAAANAQVFFGSSLPVYSGLPAYPYYGARLAPLAYSAPLAYTVPAPIATSYVARAVVAAPATVSIASPKATYTAETPGSIHHTNLPGHYESVVAENLDLAPGVESEE